MRAQQIIILDIPPKSQVILHERDEAGPRGALALGHVILLGKGLLDEAVEALLAELLAELAREVVVLLRRVGLDLEP